MPWNPREYPKDWKERVARVKTRAENRCEFCGLPNGITIFRDPETGEPEKNCLGGVRDFTECLAELDSRSMEGDKFTKVVLTVAHLDRTTGDPERDGPLDCPDDRLAALCQRCHLNLDAERHRVKQSRTLAARKNAGVGTLFPSE